MLGSLLSIQLDDARVAVDMDILDLKLMNMDILDLKLMNMDRLNLKLHL